MICPKCGANNIDGSSSCFICGTNLKDIQSLQQVNQIPIQNGENNYQQQLMQQNINSEQPINNQIPI